jgi:hypothetical protein
VRHSLFNLARRVHTKATLENLGISVPSLVWKVPAVDNAGETWDVTEVGAQRTRPTATDPLVLTVEKSQGSANPFAMGVTIGRVENNDIFVDDASVSRFHAWLQHDERKNEWLVCDAESKNGSWLDGNKLSPNQKVKVVDGSLLRLGDAELRFLLPSSLLAFIQRPSR